MYRNTPITSPYVGNFLEFENDLRGGKSKSGFSKGPQNLVFFATDTMLLCKIEGRQLSLLS